MTTFPDSRPEKFHEILSVDELDPEGTYSLEGRDMLSPAIVRTFLNVMARWKIDDDDSRSLLGEMSKRAYSVLKEGGVQILGRDTTRRISHLLNYSSMLNALYTREEAGRWMQAPITHEPFTGKTPLAFLREGDLPEFRTVRRFLEAELNADEAPGGMSVAETGRTAGRSMSRRKFAGSAIAGSFHRGRRKDRDIPGDGKTRAESQ